MKRLYLLSLLVLILAIPCSWAAHSATSLRQSTLELLHLNQVFTTGKMNAAQMAMMVEVAKSRQKVLTTTLQKSPIDIEKYLLLKKISDGFPAEVKPYIESEVSNIEGSLEVRAALPPPDEDSNPAKVSMKTEPIEYVLTTAKGLIYYLHFTDTSGLNLRTGSHLMLKHAFVIPTTSSSNQLLVTPADVVIMDEAELKAFPDAFGTQKAIVMLVNFQDQPTNKPWTLDTVKNVVFNTVNNMLYEYSYHQTSVSGDVIGWYTIGINSNASCDTLKNSVPTMADAAATKAGINLSNYKRKIYMFPRNGNCSWAGLGTIGGNPSRIWLNGYNHAGVTGHELGHNLGLQHSHSLECTGTVNVGSSCKQVEYGDVADIEGYPYTYPYPHYNAFQKERLGWLNYQSSPPIQTITTSGTYNIYPYEALNNQVKALKILKKAGTNGANDYYYLELRTNLGFDKSLATCTDCDFTKGVLFHQANVSNGSSSEVLDMSPTDNNRRLATLLPGKSFTDSTAPNGGVTIAVNSVSAAGASVTVTLGNLPPTCVKALHTMTISPTTTQWVNAGGKADYVITLTNNDSAACQATSFTLSTTDQPCWVKSMFNTTSLKVAPGKSATANLTLVSSSIAPTNIYNINVTSKNDTTPANTAAVLASLGINASSAKTALACPKSF